MMEGVIAQWLWSPERFPATPELGYLNTIVAREVTNGMWFLASVFLMASMLKFLWPILRRNARIWDYGPHIKLAWAIFLISLGSAMRAGWIWALLIASDLKAHSTIFVLQEMVFISYLAIAVGIWGCACAVKAITEALRSPRDPSPWGYWTFMVMVIVLVPIGVNLVLALYE